MHEIELSSLAFGGDAVGFLDGKVVFVPFGAPGDLAKVRIIKETASYYRGELLEVRSPGPSRREPFCPLFGSCGGCQWQHIAYEQQALRKSEIFIHAMTEARVMDILPLTKSPKEHGYRRRVRMQWTANQGNVRLGFYRWHSKEILDVPACPLVTPQLQTGIVALRQLLRGGVRGSGNGVLLAGQKGQVHLSLRLDAGDAVSLEARLQGDLPAPLCGAHVQMSEGVFDVGLPSVVLGGTPEAPLRSSAAAFAQANPEQDELLRQRVVEMAKPEGLRVLELFAGTGNLTHALAARAAEVLAVESSPQAVMLLCQNATVMPCPVSVDGRSSEDVIQELAYGGERFDVVVLDPPREGCPRICSMLAQLEAARIVYVSCDPMTLSRDLGLLTKQGYRVVRAQPQDMMPQTFHIEGIVLLERSGQSG